LNSFTKNSVVKLALDGRHYVLVCFVVLGILGSNALMNLPVQLLPTIQSNTIEITNDWPAASVEEVATLLVVPMEELLGNVSGMQEMVSDISEGWATTTLRFTPSTDMERAYIDVVNRVNQQANRPQAAREPDIVSQANGIKTAVATLLMFESDNRTGFNRDLVSKAFRQHVRPAVQSIDGVDQLITSFNPVDQRLDVEFDPIKLAAYNLTIQDLRTILRGATDRSAGRIELGSREYSLRYKGREDIDELGNIQITSLSGRKIFLKDIAQVKKNYFVAPGGAFRNGNRVLYVRVNQAYAANSLKIIDNLKRTLEQLNQGVLKDLGVEVTISRDDSKSINDAINVVKTSLLVGMLLATLVLFVFIREFTVILIIFSQIPIAILFTAFILQLFDRTLNIVSLVGVALSTGLIIDASIVVVENILRHKKKPKLSEGAVVKAVSEVSLALVTSVISSVVVFLPILYMQAEEGQLFKDLAITISSTLISSLILAVTILPILCKRFLVNINVSDSIYQKPNAFLEKAVKKVVSLGATTYSRRIILFLLLVVPIVSGTLLLPGADILPDAKDRVVRVGLQFGEKMSLDALNREVVSIIVDRLETHRVSGAEPAIERFVLFYSVGGGTMYVYPKDTRQSQELVTALDKKLLVDLPGVYAFTHIASLLRLSLSGSRNVIVDLQGVPIKQLMVVASQGLALIREKFPDVRVRATSPLSFDATQVRIVPRESEIQLAGESRQGFGEIVRALNDGIYVNEYFDGQRNIPMFIKGPHHETLNDFLDTPIYTKNLGVQPLLQYINIEFATGPATLVRVNGETTISLAIRPPEGQSLESLVSGLQEKIEPQLRNALGENGRVMYRGSASKLEELLDVMLKQFSFALLILFLLMFAMFRSLRNATLVMLSLPIAVFGGIVALNILTIFVEQSLDVMTMVGFVILLGLVINNTILFMSQLNQDTDSLQIALANTIKLRVRPIYMSTITSLLGILPLALVPGIGTEIYRGLAVVIVGGMSFSALFTIILLTALAQTPLYRHIHVVSDTKRRDTLENMGLLRELQTLPHKEKEDVDAL